MVKSDTSTQIYVNIFPMKVSVSAHCCHLRKSKFMAIIPISLLPCYQCLIASLEGSRICIYMYLINANQLDCFHFHFKNVSFFSKNEFKYDLTRELVVLAATTAGSHLSFTCWDEINLLIQLDVRK